MDNLDFLEMDHSIGRHNEDSYGRGNGAPVPRTFECKYCGKTGLLWVGDQKGKMRLTEPTKLHTCEAYLEAHGL